MASFCYLLTPRIGMLHTAPRCRSKCHQTCFVDEWTPVYLAFFLYYGSLDPITQFTSHLRKEFPCQIILKALRHPHPAVSSWNFLRLSAESEISSLELDPSYICVSSVCITKTSMKSWLFLPVAVMWSARMPAPSSGSLWGSPLSLLSWLPHLLSRKLRARAVQSITNMPKITETCDAVKQKPAPGCTVTQILIVRESYLFAVFMSGWTEWLLWTQDVADSASKSFAGFHVPIPG